MLTPQQRNRLVPVIVSIPVLIQHLDSTGITTALPTMAQDLGVHPLHLNLAVTSYLMSLAVFLPLSSWFADRFGARNVFCAAILVFSAGAVSCGLTGSLGQLVLSRVIQGMGGAMMLPIGRLILLRTIPKTELVSAMVWFSVSATLGPILGPAIGGFLVTYTSWRLIFLVNVPFCLVGIALAWRFIDDIREPEASRLDIVSFLLMGGALGGLVFGFETAGRGMLPGWLVGAMIAAGAASLAVYLLHARLSANPAIDLGLLRDLPVLRAAVAGGSLVRTAMGALPFLIPMLLQLGFGMSAFKSGLISLASAVGSLATRFFLPQILRLVGFRNVLIWAAVFLSAIYLVYGQLRPSTPLGLVLFLLLIGGMGRAILMVNLGTLGYSQVPQGRVSRATALVSMAQQLFNSLGVSLAAVLLNFMLVLRGSSELAANDFWLVFTILGVMPLLALFYFVPLPPDAGADVSGHGGRRE